MCNLYFLRGPNGYQVGMDIHRVWTWTQFITHGFFQGWTKTVFMDMDMDLILFNPIQTRPIAIHIDIQDKSLSTPSYLCMA